MEPIRQNPSLDQRAICHAVALRHSLIAIVTSQVIVDNRMFELFCVFHTIPKVMSNFWGSVQPCPPYDCVSAQAFAFSFAIHWSTSWPSTSSGTEPLLRTMSWKPGSENLSPSSALAFSRSSTMRSMPIM